MNDRLAFRDAAPRDVPAIRDVAHDCWKHDNPDVVSRATIREGIAEWYDGDRMRSQLAGDDTVVVTCVDETDSVVGFAHATREGDVGDVLRLYVAPGYRGDGVGSALLDATVEELLADGAERIRAMTLAANEPGNAFYRASEFERIGTSDTTIAGESHEEAVYEREL